MDRRNNNSCALREAGDPRRLWRWCLLATLHDLKRSVYRGQPMSLPNVLRRLRRRHADAGLVQMASLGHADGMLRALYFAEQPFSQTDWRRAVALGGWR